MSASTSSEEFEFEGSPPHQPAQDVSMSEAPAENAAVTATMATTTEAASLENPSNGEQLPDKPSMDDNDDADGDETNKRLIDDSTPVPTATEFSLSPAEKSKLRHEQNKAKAAKATTKAVKATEKTTTATATKKPKSNTKAKKPAPKSTKKNTNNNNNKKTTAAKTKSGKATTATAKCKKEEEEASAAAAAALDLFTKHYKEFERCLTRLEKVDLYRFFWDPAPEEFVEDYSPKKLTTTTEEDDKGSASKDGDTQNDNTGATIMEYPSHPPFNWEMVRRRHDHGRYVLNIKQREKLRLLEIARCLQNGDCSSSWEPPTISVMYETMVDWDLFKEDIIGMCNSAEVRNADDLGDGKAGSLSHAIKKILVTLDQIYEKTGRRHINDVIVGNDRNQFSTALEKTKNAEAAFQGKWRQTPFPERKYERLPHKNVVCAGLSELDERIASYELRTSLPDSFVGVSYKFEDDTGKSEGWMKSVLTETGGKKKAQEAAMALAEDEGVIRAQVTTCMEMLLIAVQDKCLTEADVLHQPELRSANWEQDRLRIDESDKASVPDIVEQPVWGIDCYTRRNVSICLETEFDKVTALVFIEKWLLPAINACPVDLAHDIANAAKILEDVPFEQSNDTATLTKKEENGEETGNTSTTPTEDRWSHSLIGKSLKNKIETTGPPWLKHAARLLLRAREAMGPNFFRVHPKGHGSIVLRPTIKPNTLVTFYRGEVYPSWRWGEKMDAIDITQARKKLKPALPDFYNMALEVPAKVPLSNEQRSPSSDPSGQKDRGYGLLFVDASRKAGHGSSVSHSCAPTCEVRVAAVGGELCLAMTTIRALEMGEELTFDYNAVTESLVEYRSAVCLCGFSKCRGSFLHFATADCYQKMLHRNAPVAVRFANLAKGCMKEVMSPEDRETLQNHGFLTAAFGAISFNRHKASESQSNDQILDSMANVPVWLRTYVADTLRYIEYERRALPISLICEDLSKPNADATCTTLEVSYDVSATEHQDEDDDNATEEADPGKPAKGSRPMPSFFFYCRENDKRFRAILKDDEGLDEKDLKGLEHSRAIKRIAASQWKLLSAEEKAKWKKKSEKDWEKQNGQTVAAAEKKRKQCSGNGAKSNPKAKKKRRKSKESLESKFESSNVSFQAADAEGAAAMEQRIQQLTQSLSRVGRVLDRHREAVHVAENCGEEASSDTLRRQVHPPLAVATDDQVVAWLWNGDGIVPTLLAKIQTEECVSPALKAACKDIKKKYEYLDKFGCHWSLPEDYKDFAVKPRKARRKVVAALMEFRKAILKDLKSMARDLKKEKLREKTLKKKRIQDEKNAEADSESVKTEEHGASEIPDAISPKEEPQREEENATEASAVSVKTEEQAASAEIPDAVSPKEEPQQERQLGKAESMSGETETSDAVAPKGLVQPQPEGKPATASPSKPESLNVNDATPMQPMKEPGNDRVAGDVCYSNHPTSPAEEASSQHDQTKAATAIVSCESSTATPSLLVEDSNAAESPVLVSREVYSEVETTARKLCITGAEEATASTIAQEGSSSPGGPPASHASQEAEELPASDVTLEPAPKESDAAKEDEVMVNVTLEPNSRKLEDADEAKAPSAEPDTTKEDKVMVDVTLEADPRQVEDVEEATQAAPQEEPDTTKEDEVMVDVTLEPDSRKADYVERATQAALEEPDATNVEEGKVVAPEQGKVVAPEQGSRKFEDADKATQAPSVADAVKMEVTAVLEDLVDKVVAQTESTDKDELAQKEMDEEEDDKPKPWLQHYGHRYKLQAAADLLLLYAKTSTFFLLQPYKPLKSTPIEVYAREIGNTVPRAAIDKSVASKGKPNEKAPSEDKNLSPGEGGANASAESTTVDKKPSKRKAHSGETEETVEEEALCEQDDIVAEVTVKYQGDYVLSQLLQWYNAGIGQSPGLPETLGCIRLPPMSGCWSQKAGSIAKSKMEKPTPYESKTRPCLVKWFSDPYQRGSPWPNEVKAAFSNKGSADLPSDTSSLFLPLGSPVLDLLVTGDDSNIHSILEEFGAGESKKGASGGLLSTLDEGRPAQAVSNWVQCEACLKWRRIPWHVDIDVLAKHFVCKKNKWNRASNSCEAPEDKYEDEENDVVRTFSPGKKPPQPEAEEEDAVVPVAETVKKAKKEKVKKPAPDVDTFEDVIPVDESSLVPGARFDVLREGKSKFTVGVVVKVTNGDDTKRVTFHFPHTHIKHDVCMEVGTKRIATLYSKVKRPEKRSKKSEQKPKQKQKQSKRPLVENDDNVTAKVLDFTGESAPDGEVSSKPVDSQPLSFSQPTFAAPDGAVSSKPKAEVCPPVDSKLASYDILSSSAAATTSRCDDVTCEEAGQQTSTVASSPLETPEQVNPLDAGFIQKLKDKMKEEKKKEKEERKRLKKEKKKKKRKLSPSKSTSLQDTTTSTEGTHPHLSETMDPTACSKRAKTGHSQVYAEEPHAQQSADVPTNSPVGTVAAGPTTFAGIQAMASHPQVQHTEQPQSLQYTQQSIRQSRNALARLQGPASATTVGAEALDALASLVSLRTGIPRKPLDSDSGASAMQNMAPVATSPLNAGGRGRQDPVASNQFAGPLNNDLPSSSNGTTPNPRFAQQIASQQQQQQHNQFARQLRNDYNDMPGSLSSGTTSNRRYDQRVAPQQPQHNQFARPLNNGNQRYDQQIAPQQPRYNNLSPAYSGMDDPLQRMQEMQRAVDVEMQRQRFQQRVHAEIAAEIQRQRGNAYLQGASMPNTMNGLQPPQARRENYPDYNYGYGYQYRDYQNDRR